MTPPTLLGVCGRCRCTCARVKPGGAGAAARRRSQVVAALPGSQRPRLGQRSRRKLRAHARSLLTPPTWLQWSTLWRTLGLSCGMRLCRYGDFPPGQERSGLTALWECVESGGALLGAGGSELGRSVRRTSGRTFTPSGRWSLRFGTRPHAGGSLSCPTSCGSRSPYRNTCGWVSASAPALMGSWGPGRRWHPLGCELGSSCLIRAVDLEPALPRR